LIYISIRISLWELPVSILEFSMMIFDDSAMSIPSVFGLSFGAIICSLDMCEPWHAFKLIWFLGLLIWVNSLRIRFSQAWKCKAWIEHNQILIYKPKYKVKNWKMLIKHNKFIVFRTYSWIFFFTLDIGMAVPPLRTFAINYSSSINNKTTCLYKTDPWAFIIVIWPFPCFNVLWGYDSSLKLPSPTMHINYNNLDKKNKSWIRKKMYMIDC